MSGVRASRESVGPHAPRKMNTQEKIPLMSPHVGSHASGGSADDEGEGGGRKAGGGGGGAAEEDKQKADPHVMSWGRMTLTAAVACLQMACSMALITAGHAPAPIIH